MKIDGLQHARGLASQSNEWLTLPNGETAVGESLSHSSPYDLNALFANSVNSFPMSMVNFSCCVCCFADVTREVTAQPESSALRMEAGVHAGV
jgi:hypothetical protein